MQINLFLSIFSFTLFISSCKIDRTIHPLSEKEHYRLRGYQTLSRNNKLKLAPDQEPGQRLIICGKLISKEHKTALKNQKIHTYHTNEQGEYDPTNPNDESTARLNGYLQTNDLGMFFLETILPGDYGSSTDNRHIHTTVFGAHPDAYDLHFKQYTTALGKRSIENSDQHFLVDLKIRKDSVLIGFVTMAIKE